LLINIKKILSILKIFDNLRSIISPQYLLLPAAANTNGTQMARIIKINAENQRKNLAHPENPLNLRPISPPSISSLCCLMQP